MLLIYVMKELVPNMVSDFVGLGQGYSFILFGYLGSADSLS